ncbi:MAG: helix-turn-helix domain-containing protein [Myxococcota bacterium]
MERKHFDDAPCPIARALAVFGDWWTPLIIRECLYGVHRFDELQSWLGISRNILTRRLDTLLTQGILERRQYQEKPVRHEYHLTDKGYDAANLLIAMMPLGDAWYFAKGREPIRLYSRKTDRRVRPVLVDADTGEPIDARELYAGPGPSFPKSPAIRRKRFAEYFARVGRGDHR